MANGKQKQNKPKRNGNGKRDGNRKGRTTTRQRFRTGSNGLSNQGAIRRPMVQKKFIESGSDFLGPLMVKASPSSTSDRILLSNSISPSAFTGTRITQLSNLWERYRFRKFRLRWVPAVPKTIACQLIIYQDTDPLDDPTIITDPDALVRQATAQAGSQQFNFINGMAIDLAKRSDDQLYYTGNDKQNARFNRQGNFYVIQVTNPLNFNGEPITTDIMAGSLYVDWVCEFQIAQINPAAAMPCAVNYQVTEIVPVNTQVSPTTPLVWGSVTINAASWLDFGRIQVSHLCASCSVDGILASIDTSQTDSVGSFISGSTTTAPLPALFQAGTYPISFLAFSQPTSILDFTVQAFSADPNMTITYTA